MSTSFSFEPQFVSFTAQSGKHSSTEALAARHEKTTILGYDEEKMIERIIGKRRGWGIFAGRFYDLVYQLCAARTNDCVVVRSTGTKR